MSRHSRKHAVKANNKATAGVNEPAAITGELPRFVPENGPEERPGHRIVAASSAHLAEGAASRVSGAQAETPGRNRARVKDRRQVQRTDNLEPNRRKKTTALSIFTQIIVLILCILLGVGYMGQQRNVQSSYSSLSESELVRLLDETNQKIDQLTSQKNQLSSQLESIQNAVDKQAELKQMEENNQKTAGVIAGTLPAQGPGVRIRISEAKGKTIPASALFSLIEELRNAGAEAIQINTVRVVTSTYFSDSVSGVLSDGTLLQAPYTVLAIGDSNALRNAIEISGGIGSTLRVQYKATVSVDEKETLKITHIRKPRTFQYARTVE